MRYGAFFLLAAALFLSPVWASRRPEPVSPGADQKLRLGELFSRDFTPAFLRSGIRQEAMPLFLEKLEEADLSGERILPDGSGEFFKTGPRGARIAAGFSRFQAMIDGLPAAERVSAADDARKRLVPAVRAAMTYRKKALLTLSGKAQFDSNVNQLPDGNIQVSNKDGGSTISGLSLKLDGRRLPWGQASLLLGASQTDYLEKDFDARNSRNFSLSLTDTFQFQDSRLMSLVPKLAFRSDYLRPRGSFAHAFDTWTPGCTVMMKPLQKKWKCSDILVRVFVVDLELRDYLGVDGRDASGADKDTVTPSLTMVLLNMKKWKSHPSRAMFILNARSQGSDSADQEYDTGRAGLAYSLTYPRWTLTPDAALTMRSQDSYLRQKREDRGYELGLALERPFCARKVNLVLSCRFIHQDSNMSLFNFDNRQCYADLSFQL